MGTGLWKRVRRLSARIFTPLIFLFLIAIITFFTWFDKNGPHSILREMEMTEEEQVTVRLGMSVSSVEELNFILSELAENGETFNLARQILKNLDSDKNRHMIDILSPNSYKSRKDSVINGNGAVSLNGDLKLFVRTILESRPSELQLKLCRVLIGEQTTITQGARKAVRAQCEELIVALKIIIDNNLGEIKANYRKSLTK